MSPSRRDGPMAVAVVLSLMVSACASLQPGRPFSSDRIAFVEGAGTVSPGGVQTEAGYTNSRVKTESYQAIGESVVRYGINSRVEVRVHGNSFAVRENSFVRQQGFEDSRLGAKLAILDSPEGPSVTPSVSITVSTSVPTGARAFGQRAWQPESRLAMEWQLPAHAAFTVNGAMSQRALGVERYTESSGGASFSVPISSRVTPWAGWHKSTSTYPVEEVRQYVSGGVSFLVSNNIQFDVRGGRGRNDLPRDNFYGFGISRRWK